MRQPFLIFAQCNQTNKLNVWTNLQRGTGMATPFLWSEPRLGLGLDSDIHHLNEIKKRKKYIRQFSILYTSKCCRDTSVQTGVILSCCSETETRCFSNSLLFLPSASALPNHHAISLPHLQASTTPNTVGVFVHSSDFHDTSGPVLLSTSVYSSQRDDRDFLPLLRFFGVSFLAEKIHSRLDRMNRRPSLAL